MRTRLPVSWTQSHCHFNEGIHCLHLAAAKNATRSKRTESAVLIWAPSSDTDTGSTSETSFDQPKCEAQADLCLGHHPVGGLFIAVSHSWRTERISPGVVLGPLTLRTYARPGSTTVSRMPLLLLDEK